MGAEPILTISRMLADHAISANGDQRITSAGSNRAASPDSQRANGGTMKRDVDLIRHLMFEIERQGADCAVDTLRNGAPSHELDERARYHVRLLVDAGLAKEVERTSTSSPCVRLTSAGHEFLDLCRGEERWRQAKWLVQEQTGGLSLTVLRAVLTKWAMDGISRRERYRRWRRSYRPAAEREFYGPEPGYGEPAYRVQSYRYEREPVFDDEPVQLVRPRRDYRDAIAAGERWEQEQGANDHLISDETLGVSLPVHMI